MGKARQRFESVAELLRGRIRGGELTPGQHVGALEVAGELRLSDTPVRQVLALLAGQGLLEARAGEGYFVPRMDAEALIDLYRVNQMVLLYALRGRKADRHTQGGAIRAFSELDLKASARPRELAAFQERLFRRIVRDSGSALLLDILDRLCDRLAAARLAENEVINDAASELERLAKEFDDAPRAALSRSIAAFHARRQNKAADIVRRLTPDVDDDVL